MESSMHPRSHERRRIRPTNTYRTSCAELLRYERVFVRHEIVDRGRASSARHAGILHRVFDSVWNAFELSARLANSASRIAGCGFFEYLWV